MGLKSKKKLKEIRDKLENEEYMNEAINFIAGIFADYYLGYRMSGMKRKQNTLLIKQIVESLKKNMKVEELEVLGFIMIINLN